MSWGASQSRPIRRNRDAAGPWRPSIAGQDVPNPLRRAKREGDAAGGRATSRRSAGQSRQVADEGERPDAANLSGARHGLDGKRTTWL